MTKLVPYITAKPDQFNVKHAIHSFDSGSVMIDVFTGNKMYVIQIDGDVIGLSLVTEDTLLSDIIPDRSFKMRTLLKLNSNR